MATSLALLLDAPSAHAFYILWGSVTLIGASHGALGQGMTAGVLSTVVLRSCYGFHLDVTPTDSGTLAQAFAFLVFAVWACRLNAVRARARRAAKGRA